MATATDKANGVMTQADLDALQAELAKLRAENAKLADRIEYGRSLSMKVTEKGGLSVYGLQRFPITLYKNQWRKLAKAMPQILDYIQENEAFMPDKA